MIPIIIAAAAAAVAVKVHLDKKTQEQIRRGREAIKKVLATKKDVPNAMEHPALGPIDFIYGRHDSATGRGMGIAHAAGSARDRLKKYRDGETAGKILYRAPEVIMRGRHEQSHKGKLKITHKEYLVLLKNQLNGRPSNHWVFHAYDDNPRKKEDAVGKHGERKHRKRR